jgi:hypothetical protein
MKIETNYWYIFSKFVTIIFVNAILYLILLKNDNVDWLSRATSFYNFRNFDTYSYISNIGEDADVYEDVGNSVRVTGMEERIQRIKDNMLGGDYLFFNKFFLPSNTNDDLRIRVSI